MPTLRVKDGYYYVRDDNERLHFSSTLSVGNVCVIPDLSEQLRPAEPGGPGHHWS